MDARPLPPRPNLGQYRKQAKDLLAAARAGDADAVRRLERPHREPGDASAGSPPERRTLADAQLAIAREHAFESWPRFVRHVEGLADGPVLRFERAADAVIAGEIDALRTLLAEDPSLPRARSTRAHHATLLHYVAANGVEDFRQRSPSNAAAVARLLLARGAEVDASADSYGGDWDTTLNLLVSSVHPAVAGVQVELVDVLVDHGAAVEGTPGDGSPLITALAFHYPAAAEALARRGARADSVLAVAGLGLAELLPRFVAADGTVRTDAPLARVAWLRLPRDHTAHAERALLWAAAHGRTAVVERLARARLDLAARDGQGFTALHWAAFHGHLGAVDALLAAGASLEIENRYGGTVLDSTVWAAVHSGLSVDARHPDARPRVDYVPVVERLIAAGARVDAVGPIPSGNARVDAVLARHGARPR